MFQKVDAYVINDIFTRNIAKIMAKWLTVSRYFSNYFYDFGKIDLPRITHAKFHNEIRILSAICMCIDYEMLGF